MPKQFVLYLVRHGMTSWNHLRRTQGHLDIPLSSEGKRQAAALSQRFVGLPISALYSSPLQRAYQTAEAVAQVGGAVIKTDTRLRERSFGLLEGEHSDFWQKQPRFELIKSGWLADRQYYRIPAGESYADVEARVRAFWQDLLQTEPVGNVVVVSHSWVKRAFFAILLGADFDAVVARLFGNTALSILHVSYDDAAHFKTTIEMENDMSHLTAGGNHGNG